MLNNLSLITVTVTMLNGYYDDRQAWHLMTQVYGPLPYPGRC